MRSHYRSKTIFIPTRLFLKQWRRLGGIEMSSHFDQLKSSLDEVGRIVRGEVEAARETVFDDHILIEIREDGETVWLLEDAVAELKKTDFSSISNPAAFLRTVRRTLKQSQSGMAQIYGVPVRTYERWEQDERINTRASAKTSLIRLMAKEPDALVRAARNPTPRIGFTSST